MRFKPIVLAAAILLVVMACAPEKLIVSQMTAMVDHGITAFERDSNLDLVEKAIPANIKLLETMLANSPTDDRLATLIARLYGSYGFGFIETRLDSFLYDPASTNPDSLSHQALKAQLDQIYQKGIDYALTALDQRMPGGRTALANVATIGPYLDRLDRSDVGPLFWYGFNLGAWVNRNLNSVRAVSQAHVARKVMERVLELDPGYNTGGAHLFLLAYFGSRAPMMGGNPARAYEHYRQLKQIVGKEYLLADLFYARFYLPQQQDRDGFVAIMQRIIHHPPSDDSMALHNAIAARRASIYLTAVDQFFESR